MKRNSLIALFAGIAAFGCAFGLSACGSGAETDGNFNYKLSGDTYQVVGYAGSSTEISIPATFNGKQVTSIAASAFKNSEDITSVIIPESVTNIGNEAFSGCGKVSGITLPSTVTQIGKKAFYQCTLLANVNIPANVVSIGNEAFAGCSKISSITIPEGVTQIGNSTFKDCNELSTVTISESLTKISESAFYGCTNLESFIVSENNKIYSSQDGILFNKDKTKIVTVPKNIQGSITVPDTVTSLGYSFYYCSSIENITIPDSINVIYGYMFEGCNSLESITVSESNKNYSSQDGILYDKDKTEFIAVPKNIKGSITIPDTVVAINGYTFSACSNLESISVSESNVNYSSLNGIVYNKDKTEIIVIPQKIKGAITINGEITSIGERAFTYRNELTGVTVSDGITSIGNGAFGNCLVLSSVTISADVTSIGQSAFVNCSSLASVNFQGTKEQWNAIEKGSNWNYGTGNYTIHCTDGDVSK